MTSLQQVVVTFSNMRKINSNFVSEQREIIPINIYFYILDKRIILDNQEFFKNRKDPEVRKVLVVCRDVLLDTAHHASWAWQGLAIQSVLD